MKTFLAIALLALTLILSFAYLYNRHVQKHEDAVAAFALSCDSHDPDSRGRFEKEVAAHLLWRQARSGGQMTNFDTKRLPSKRDAVAPDGSDVRILLGLKGVGMAHFELPPAQTSTAVKHRTVEEIWFFLSGRGEMWRKQGGREEIVKVDAGVCLTIPLGTQFQFRSFGDQALVAAGVTMPPWPGEGEAIVVKGKWKPTLPTLP